MNTKNPVVVQQVFFLKEERHHHAKQNERQVSKVLTATALIDFVL